MAIDIAIIIILCLFSIVGYKKGMLTSLFSLFSVILSIFLTYLLIPYVSKLVFDVFSLRDISVDWINIDSVVNFFNSNSKIATFIKFLFHIDNTTMVNNLFEIIINGILFIVLGLSLRIAFKSITKRLISVFKKLIIIGTLDKICGVLLGFIKGALLSCFICFTLTALVDLNVFNSVIQMQIYSSSMLPLFADGSNYIIQTISHFIII